MIPWPPGVTGRLAANLRETFRVSVSEQAETGGLVGGKGAACLLLQKNILYEILRHSFVIRLFQHWKHKSFYCHLADKTAHHGDMNWTT